MILKILGNETGIDTYDTLGGANLVRIINTGAAATLTFYSNVHSTYGTMTVSNTESIVVEKLATDLIQGNNMHAVPIAYRY